MQSILEFDVARQRPAVNGLDVYILDDPASLSVDLAKAAVTVTHASAARVVVGGWYILRHQVYALNTFTLQKCSGAVFKDVTIYSAAGMGLYAQFSTDITLRSFNVAKRMTDAGPRPMSITADAVHCNACNGTVLIADSLFEGQGDDGLNVHGKFGVVESITSSTTITMQKDDATEHCGMLATVGDTIEFRRRDSFQHVTTATLKAVVGLNATLDLVPMGIKRGDLIVSLSWMPTFVVSEEACG